MACDDCGASGCLCIESIGPGLSWDGSELGFDEGGLAADLLSTDACQVLTLGTDGKLFTRERAAGWGVSTVVGPQLFSGAGIPASGTVLVNQTLPITNPSACQWAEVVVHHRIPAISMNAAQNNAWRINATTTQPTQTSAPVAWVDARIAAFGGVSIRQAHHAEGSHLTRLVLGPGGTALASISVVFTRVAFAASASNSLLVGSAGIIVRGVFSTP